MSGYQDALYAEALAEFGTPLHLPRSNGWILTSPIADSPLQDARACYPLFSCQQWSALKDDLAHIGNSLVSLVMVTDPFGDYIPDDLRECFPDMCAPYKDHFVIDLQQPLEAIISGHHARNIRKALAHVEVERCEQPLAYAEEWEHLYTNLVQRHEIKGIAAFSERSFQKQLQVPGLVMFRAVHDGQTVGMVLWYVQQSVGYYHLAAYSDLGYELKASFALFARAIEYFAPQLRWLNLGAGAGLHASSDDGLTRFKRGWSTGTRPVYLCGRIFDHKQYDELVQVRGIVGSGFFPLYRKGEVR